MPGRLMSIRITSGRWARASADLPSVASRALSMRTSGWPSMICLDSIRLRRIVFHIEQGAQRLHFPALVAQAQRPSYVQAQVVVSHRGSVRSRIRCPRRRCFPRDGAAISSTSCLVNTRPMPVPSSAPVSCPRRLNGLKQLRQLFRRQTRTAVLDADADALGADHGALHLDHSLFRLYLIALDSRLISACLTRVWSAWAKQVGSTLAKLILMPRCCARRSDHGLHSSSTSDSDKGSSDSDNLPDSITASVEDFVDQVQQYQPAFDDLVQPDNLGGRWRRCTRLQQLGEAEDALSGVRSSWLMLDRKFDFARLAFSATAWRSPARRSCPAVPCRAAPALLPLACEQCCPCRSAGSR